MVETTDAVYKNEGVPLRFSTARIVRDVIRRNVCLISNELTVRLRLGSGQCRAKVLQVQKLRQNP
eukprot:6839978-Pyramimonas_sp.AAC.1